MAYTPRTAPDPNEKGYPRGIKYIIGNEGCERFSYYGMRAILQVYIFGLFVSVRGMDPAIANNEASATYHMFSAAVYALPLIGAMLADRLLGKYRTIVWLSIVYCIGHVCLAVFEDPDNIFGVDPVTGLYVGLGLIALGSGGIKPCVSAHVGDQFGKSNWTLVEKIYSAFYFIINFGSAFATILIPIVRGKEITPGVYEGSVGWAFAIPGILMALATVAFWMGRKVFVHVPATHPGKRGLLDVLSGTSLFMVIGWPIFFGGLTDGWVIDVIISAACLVAFVVLFGARQQIEQDDGFLALTFFTVKAKLTKQELPAGPAPRAGVDDLRDHWLYGPAARKFGNKAAEGPIAVWKIISIFIFISMFWALFDQHGSTWVVQARSMDRLIDLTMTGYLIAGAGLGFVVGFAVLLTIGGSAKKWLVSMAIGMAVGLTLGWIAAKNGPYDLAPSQIGAANPFMVMILIPLTTFGLYPLMAKVGIDPHPLRRMTMGMMVAGLSFVAVAVIQARIDTGGTGSVHVAWQMIPYVIITLAEVMVSITGLEFAYTQAPKRMKSVVMGFWLFNVTLGNLLVAFIVKLPDMTPATFFWVFAGLMFAAGTLFGLRAKFYRYKDFTQDVDSAEPAPSVGPATPDAALT